MPPLSSNKAEPTPALKPRDRDVETWRRHQKSKKGVSVAPQKGLVSSKNFKKKKIINGGPTAGYEYKI